MVDLVKYLNGSSYTDSYILADKFDKKHEYICRKIEQLVKRLGTIKFAPKNNSDIAEIKRKSKNYRGQTFKYYILNRKAFSLLAMSFSGDKAFEWQNKFYDAFSGMERVLLNKSDTAWKQVRNDSKSVRLELTGCIAEFVEYCFSQGSNNAKRYYTTITKMEYAALEFLQQKEKVPSGFRDTLDKMELFMLVMAEHVANETIKKGMEDKLHYKEIFILAKQAVLKYADSVLLKRVGE